MQYCLKCDNLKNRYRRGGRTGYFCPDCMATMTVVERHNMCQRYRRAVRNGIPWSPVIVKVPTVASIYSRHKYEPEVQSTDASFCRVPACRSKVDTEGWCFEHYRVKHRYEAIGGG